MHPKQTAEPNISEGPKVILGPYTPKASIPNTSPPAPAYLTINAKKSTNKSVTFSDLKQIFINCITLRNYRVFFRRLTPRGLMIFLVIAAVIFLGIKWYHSDAGLEVLHDYAIN
jgi:hypothetical protein